MQQLFIDATSLPLDEIKSILAVADKKAVKMRLAREVVTMYHSADEALRAEDAWQSTFSAGGIPEDAPTMPFKDALLVDAFIEMNIISSKGEFTRLILENAIKTITDDGEETIVVDRLAKLLPNHTYKIGKKRFLKIV
jgi:tyrosyl-tRNA synthetase